MRVILDLEPEMLQKLGDAAFSEKRSRKSHMEKILIEAATKHKPAQQIKNLNEPTHQLEQEPPKTNYTAYVPPKEEIPEDVQSEIERLTGMANACNDKTPLGKRAKESYLKQITELKKRL